MEAIGVEAIVEGMMSFSSDMDKIQGKIDDIGVSGTVFGQIFEGVSGVISSFGREVLNVAEVALGVLLRDAIQGVIGLIGDLINKTIEAGSEFQTLTLRLNGMNLDALIKSGKDYNTATSESIQLTQEQLSWLQKLAAATPYDNTDISKVYSMARGYGFADEQARSLTEDTANFASAMGLSGQHMERIIVNLGQMQARGKITSSELRDLARGAFLPLDDLLKRIVDDMNASNKGFVDNSGAIAVNNAKLDDLKTKLAIAIQKQKEFTDKTKESTRMINQATIDKLRDQIDKTTGSIGALANQSKKLMTVADLTKEISKPSGGVPAEYFIKAFQEMVAEEPRFTGASTRMARTFKAATDNAKDLVVSFGGLNVVTPILDVLGGKIADFMDQFIKSDSAGQQFTALGERFREASAKVGEALSSIVESVLGLLPSSGDLAESLVGGLEKGAEWLTTNKGVIVETIQGIVDKIKDGIDWFTKLFAPPVENATNKGIVAMLYDLSEQLFKVNPRDEVSNFERLQKVLGELGQVIGDILLGTLDMLGIDTLPRTDDSVRNFINALQSLVEWMRENEKWIKIVLVAIAGFLILQFVVGLFWSFVATLIATVTAIATTVAALAGAVVVIGTVMAAITLLELFFNGLKVIFTLVFTFIAERLTQLVLNTIATFDDMRNAIINKDWLGLGIAIIMGIVRGIQYNTTQLIDAMVNAAMAAFDAAKNALGIHSPSTLFAGIGENMMVGMAEGIAASADIAVNAMRGVVSAVSAPAMNLPAVTASYSQAAPSSISSTYQSNTTNNLNIYSQAQTEQVAASFAMMNSLAGV